MSLELEASNEETYSVLRMEQVIPVGLLDKTNPRATWQSVIRFALYGAVSVPAFFFVCGKPEVRENWPVLLPVFAIFGAAIAALLEWQANDDPDETDDDCPAKGSDD